MSKTCSKCGVIDPACGFPVKAQKGKVYEYPYCLDCKRAKARELTRQYSQTEVGKAKRKAWKEANIEKEYASVKRWREKHPGYDSIKSKRWAEANTERKRVLSAVSAARCKCPHGEFTTDEFLALCDKYGNRCLCCGEVKPLSPEHIVPISQGGTNDISNIQPLCHICNLRKGTRTIDYRPQAEKG